MNLYSVDLPARSDMDRVRGIIERLPYCLGYDYEFGWYVFGSDANAPVAFISIKPEHLEVNQHEPHDPMTIAIVEQLLAVLSRRYRRMFTMQRL